MEETVRSIPCRMTGGPRVDDAIARSVSLEVTHLGISLKQPSRTMLFP